MITRLSEILRIPHFLTPGLRNGMVAVAVWRRVLQRIVAASSRPESEIWCRCCLFAAVQQVILLLLYFKRHMQPIGYGVAIYILGFKPSVILFSLQFLIKHSVDVLLLLCYDSPCNLPCIMLSAAYAAGCRSRRVVLNRVRSVFLQLNCWQIGWVTVSSIGEMLTLKQITSWSDPVVASSSTT